MENLCSGCGSQFRPEAKFCSKCGTPKPVQNDAPTPSVPPPPPPSVPPSISAPPPQQQYHQPAPQQPMPSPAQQPQQSRLGLVSILIIVFSVILLLCIGGTVWYFFGRSTPATQTPGTQLSQAQTPAIVQPPVKTVQPPVETVQPPKKTPKPPKNIVKPATPTIAPTPSPKPDSDSNNRVPRVIFDNWNIDLVYNNPQSTLRFYLGRKTYITQISTYHWNNGQGAYPGTISLVHENGTIYGPWNVSTTSGQGGAPNVNWICYPNTYIPQGNYTVKDSDPFTWSHNRASGSAGFSKISGF